MQDRIENATRNIVFGVVLKVCQILIPFIMRTIIIYLLGVEYAGLSSLFTSILQVLNLAELGVGSAMVYSMYKPIAENNSARICALLKMYKIYYKIIGLVIAVIGIALTPMIPRLVKGEVPSDISLITLYYLNLGAVVISYWLFAYKSSILLAHQRADVVSKVVIVTNMLQYLLQFIVLFTFRNYYYFVIVALITQVISNIITAVFATKMYPDYQPRGELDVKEKKIVNNKIKDLFFIRIGSIVVDSVDSIVISAFLGLKMLTIYQNYFYIMNSVYMLLCTIITAIVASVGNSLITESDKKNYSDFETLTFIMSAILCVCCNCFIGLYQPFMKLWVGETLMMEFPFVILLCVYFYVRLTASIWNVPKDAAGLWHSDRYRALVAAAVNLFLNLIFVNIMGLYGILISTIIAVLLISCPWIVRNIFKYIYKRSMKKYLLRIVEYALCTVGSCAISYFACDFLNLDGILGLAERLIETLIISSSFIFLLFSRTKEWKRGVKLVLKMLKR